MEPSSRRDETRGLQAHLKPAALKDLRAYPPIHLYPRPIKPECPYMKVYQYMGGWLAECRVMKRLLTKTEIEKCINYWRSCPIRRLAERTDVAIT